jgi:hypothetical protein
VEIYDCAALEEVQAYSISYGQFAAADVQNGSQTNI